MTLLTLLFSFFSESMLFTLAVVLIVLLIVERRYTASITTRRGRFRQHLISVLGDVKVFLDTYAAVEGLIALVTPG